MNASCYACDSAAERSCTLCGKFFCAAHGGPRNIWLDRSGGLDGPRNNLTSRVLCDACTPDQAAVERKKKQVMLLFIGILAAILLPVVLVLLGLLACGGVLVLGR